jgi:hypothetical protein
MIVGNGKSSSIFANWRQDIIKEELALLKDKSPARYHYAVIQLNKDSVGEWPRGFHKYLAGKI